MILERGARDGLIFCWEEHTNVRSFFFLFSAGEECILLPFKRILVIVTHNCHHELFESTKYTARCTVYFVFPSEITICGDRNDSLYWVYLRVSVDELRTLFLNYFFIYKETPRRIFDALERRHKVDFNVRVAEHEWLRVLFTSLTSFEEFIERFLKHTLSVYLLKRSPNSRGACTSSLVLRIQPSILSLLLLQLIIIYTKKIA